jgi:CubicO group peptidase (beta-lactamase class C family)
MNSHHHARRAHFTPHVLACAAVLAGCASHHPAPDAGAPPASSLVVTAAMRADLEAFTAAALTRYEVPGAALAIVVGNATVYQHGFGLRGLDDARPVSPDTLFMIGSITKSMTGLMTATLVDDGLLDWDARAVDVWPGFALSDPSATPQIRLRHLLSHTSGVAGHDAGFVVQRSTPGELVRSLAGIPVLSAPGAEFHYSNQAFAAAGFAAARAATGQAADADVAAQYAALMTARVFEPVGMRATTLEFDAAAASPDHALPHAYDPSVARMAALPLDLERVVGSVAPAGAVWSSAADMARYAIAAMTGIAPDGRRIVSQPALQQTQTSYVTVKPGYGYGFGWIVVDPAAYHGRRALMHTGATNGFVSHIALLPDDQLGVVVLSNQVLADGFTQAVREYAVETVLGLPHAGDDALVTTLHTTEQSLVELAASTARPSRDEVAGLVGGYGARTEVAFDDARGMSLTTDFGTLPLAALPSAPGTYVTTGVTVGLAATFASDAAGQRLTIGGLSADPAEFPLTLPRRGTYQR